MFSIVPKKRNQRKRTFKVKKIEKLLEYFITNNKCDRFDFMCENR